MATDKKRPKTRQPKTMHFYATDANGVLIIDTETGFRDEERCRWAMKQLLEAGMFVPVRSAEDGPGEGMAKAEE